MTDFDCSKLEGRARSICEGTSGLPETGPGNTREGYIALWTNSPPPVAVPVKTACVYRGLEIDRVRCQTCQDKVVEIKVFACHLFGRCVLANGTSERFCGTCQSRLENTVETE